MRLIKVLSGQTVFDIALQELGSAVGVLDIALLNGISITETLTPGQTLNVPDYVLEKNVVADFKKNGIRPATADSDSEIYTQKLFQAGLFQAGLFE
tara:strand:- start:2253 stop:2540 length:288 start_codon:yes stop_codon:yes gene_type:complete